MTTAEQESGSDGTTTTGSRSAGRVATIAVGTALVAVDQLRGGVGSVRDRTISAATGLLDRAWGRAAQAHARVLAAVDEAERRGRRGIDAGRRDATALVDTGVDGAIGWAQVTVMPQVIDGLVPHLISDVMPRLIDGALPEIRARIVPVLIDDLTNDPRIRELILAQSRGVLGQVTEQIRTGTARADDRFEVAAHRVFGRTDKGNNTTKSVHDTRGA